MMYNRQFSNTTNLVTHEEDTDMICDDDFFVFVIFIDITVSGLCGK